MRGQEAFTRFQTMEREEGLRLIVATSLGDHGVNERPELFEEIYAYRLERAPSLEAWQAQAYAGATFDAYERIPQIAAPTLVLQGGADNVIDPRNAELLAARIPGARVELIPDRGHLMMWEESELIAPIIREFLQS
jgi:pimeloyl-ACP methyl ester carboxylesterase